MEVKNFEKVKEMLCKEMDEIARGGEITAGTLTTVDTLAHAIKNIDKIIMCSSDEGYSSHGGDWIARGNYGNHYSNDGYDMSNRYSRDDGRIVDKLHRMMDEAQTDRERNAIRKAIEMLK